MTIVKKVFVMSERKTSPMDYILKDLSAETVRKKIIEDINLSREYYSDDIYRKISTWTN
ncbi:hypothetical protein FD31_GL001807 [Companilactobacillus nantensis DSM 16982]|uniref:Uncharacterized protein n=2 Tax=Companilactobacillus nantensis TaxID=305793 RepID=A0A0R1W9G4_9LACO|nr:hypothetical protein FD31_GL001807 [Companilactobacillus nantensis DSM 16982]